ncbi:hypothetical protein N665_0466s0013 [Sinapis alba]|nr:hypothetical protein N665_0466s0013 [Sinapis alba]
MFCGLTEAVQANESEVHCISDGELVMDDTLISKIYSENDCVHGRAGGHGRNHSRGRAGGCGRGNNHNRSRGRGDGNTIAIYGFESPLHLVGYICLGFTLGSMPVRYLGLPLMHRELRLCDYRPLLDKISGCFNAWSVKALSFAGRRQLISSVIYGTINFWTSAFILPKGCLRSIQSLCSRFLWSGNTNSRAVSKISWTTICLPKAEGGLGFRDLILWNKTLCLKLLWMLFEDSDSLWAAWMRENRLKEESLWSVDIEKVSSWTWCALLHLRHIAKQFIRAKIGNGRRISFWWDHWTPLGPLLSRFGSVGPCKTTISITATVSNVCCDTGWLIRGARSPAAEELHIHLTTIPLPSLQRGPDTYVWRIGNVDYTSFSTSKAWEIIRQRGQRQSWSSNTWFSGAVPRDAFTMWVANHDRLPTRARLARWGIASSSSCCLCDSATETKDHLFLQCQVSKEFWDLIHLRLLNRRLVFHTWTAFNEWISISNSSTPRLLKRLLYQATIYTLWIERNKRLHDNIASSTFQLFRSLDRLIRDIILENRLNPKFSGLMQYWLVRD